MKPLFLALGSNIEPRMHYLVKALVKIEEKIGKIKSYSNVFETDAWGNERLNLFYNMAIQLDSDLVPLEILKKTQSIEKEMGRKHEEHWQNRTIDIDIIFYGDLIYNSEILTIPHTLIHERNFVLRPLCDIDENFKHPVVQKSIKELLLQCKDAKKVKLKTIES